MLLNLVPQAAPPFTPQERGPALWLNGLGIGTDLNRPADAVITWDQYVALCDAIRPLIPVSLQDDFDSAVSNERTEYHNGLLQQQTDSSEVVTETTALLDAMDS